MNTIHIDYYNPLYLKSDMRRKREPNTKRNGINYQVTGGTMRKNEMKKIT
jgi:hypothetical protein